VLQEPLVKNKPKAIMLVGRRQGKIRLEMDKGLQASGRSEQG
jgi:hypothetical protein